VKTIVVNNPNRSASGPAARNDVVCSNPMTKNVIPKTPTDEPLLD
jgi:hypothetical protein